MYNTVPRGVELELLYTHWCRNGILLAVQIIQWTDGLIFILDLVRMSDRDLGEDSYPSICGTLAIQPVISHSRAVPPGTHSPSTVPHGYPHF